MTDTGSTFESVIKSTKRRYIVCPDINCTGFTDDILRCTLTNYAISLEPERNLKPCPHIDKAKMVVFCSCGEPLEEVVNCSSWSHSRCHKCGGISFSKMSTTTHRIPIDKYEDFKNKPFD